VCFRILLRNLGPRVGGWVRGVDSGARAAKHRGLFDETIGLSSSSLPTRHQEELARPRTQRGVEVLCGTLGPLGATVATSSNAGASQRETTLQPNGPSDIEGVDGVAVPTLRRQPHRTRGPSTNGHEHHRHLTPPTSHQGQWASQLKPKREWGSPWPPGSFLRSPERSAARFEIRPASSFAQHSELTQQPKAPRVEIRRLHRLGNSARGLSFTETFDFPMRECGKHVM
jgi:hypothetical protein